MLYAFTSRVNSHCASDKGSIITMRREKVTALKYSDSIFALVWEGAEKAYKAHFIVDLQCMSVCSFKTMTISYLELGS